MSNATHTQTHTPGPWNHLGSGTTKAHKNILSAGIVRDQYNDPVCDCRYSEVRSRDFKTPEQIHANARLIAAAPELLEALKHCIAVFRSMSERGACPQELLPFDTNNQAEESLLFIGKQGYHFAVEAIAKAEGKD